MASTLSQDGSLSTSNTNIKLRGNSGGVPLAHADVDGNFLLLMDAHNDVVSDLGAKAASSHSHSNATTSTAGFMSGTDKTKLNGIATNANNYSLPNATSSTKGGVKVGSNISVSSGTISVPVATNNANGVVKYDNSTIKKNGSGQLYVDTSVVDTNTTYVAGSGITISGNTISATGSQSAPVTLAKDSGGYQEIFDSASGLLITNRSKRVVCYINASTGVSSVPSTIGAYSIYGGGGAIQIDTKFANMQTLLGYLGKYHNVGDQQWIIFAETDFTDSALHTDSLYNQSFAAFTLVGSPQGTAKKWTINNLQGEGIFSNRGPIRIRDMHFKVNSQVGNVSHLFSSYTNGYVLLEGKVAVELATGVYFYNGIFGATEATAVYNFASNFEIKNDISGNNAQALYHVNTGGISHAPETIFSGKFQTCRFLQGGFFRFEHAGNFGGINAATRGPFIMESSYTLPQSYVDVRLPAFIFEGGQSQVLHGNQSITTDVMRYTTLLGQDERFDRHVYVGSGSFFNSQGAGSHYGVEPYERNIILYPHGNYGTDPSQTNHRGWVYWGRNPASDLPAKKAFTII